MNAPLPTLAQQLADLGPGVKATPYEAGQGLPVFVEPTDPRLANDLDAAVAWFEANRPALEGLLLSAGAVVLRGFAISDTAAFSRLIEAYPSPDFGYSGGASPRGVISGRVFEATRAPAEAVLGMHQEMAYLPHFPTKLAFYCLKPAATGGETFIADMRKLDQQVNPAFRAQVKARGVLYTRNFRVPGDSCGNPMLDEFHKTWTDTFYTEDRAKAEADCRAMGLEPRWEPNGSLSVIYRAPGFIEHPVTGQEIWFNQIATQTPNRGSNPERFDMNEQFYGGRPRPYRTTYGDGTEIDPDEVTALNALLGKLTVVFPWRHADVMILDNFYTAHGRNSYTGARDVQVALLS